MQKASVQSLAILERLEEKLDDEEDESHPLQSRHTQQQKQSKEIVTLTSKVNSLKKADSGVKLNYIPQVGQNIFFRMIYFNILIFYVVSSF